MMLMSFDTEYNRAYDVRVVCVESAALTTDTLQNQRAHAQIKCDQTVVLSQQKLLRNGRLFTAVGMGSSPPEHN